MNHGREGKNEWAEKLAYAPKNGYERLSAEEEQAMHAYCEDYKDFLDHGKTERLCVEHCIELASARGFVPYEKGMALKTGDKVYYNNRGKNVLRCRHRRAGPQPRREHRRGAHRLRPA